MADNNNTITFPELGLDPEILQALGDLGFEYPTPIQRMAIPQMLNTNRDLIGLAQTGTGKTAAFGIPILQQIDLNSKLTQALILCPTRELCMQISNDLQSYAKYLDNVRITAVYGGAGIDSQIRSIKKGSQIIVGTPGRTLDLIRRKNLQVTDIQWLVLDEADEMLTMGFKEELDGILQGTPNTKQSLLFSATMPTEIRQITKKYMNDPNEISAGKKNVGAENVKHEYYMVHANDRYKALIRIADINPDIYGIVFCRTRKETKEIADKLIQDGYNADALHGDLSQAQRDIVMNRFREKHLQLLIATDVAARGLDVSDLSHIINFGLPDESELYIHRSGRTGRAGKSGVCISIAHSRASNKIKVLENKLGKQFTRMLVPDGKQICEIRLYNMIDKLAQVEVDEEKIKPFLDDIYNKVENFSREDIIKKFVWVEFKRFLSYYKNSVDLNVATTKEKKKPQKERRKVQFAKFYINLGLRHRMSAQKLMGIINENLRSKDAMIGKINIMKKFSFFEIDQKYMSDVMTSFDGAKYNGENILIEPVKNDGQVERRKRQEKQKKWRNKK